MASSVQGRLSWEVSRDAEGHREYTVAHLVLAAVDDGPQVVMVTPGLPTVGSLWQFGNDLDAWAFCYPTMKVSPYKEREGEPHRYWRVEQPFGTKPLKRCQDESIEDPLLEPWKVSGSFVKYTREVTKNYDGTPAVTSAYELIHGPPAQFEFSNPTVRLEHNTATLGLATFSQMVDTLNDAALWGLTTRKIKLSDVSWERKLYGTCNYYYTRALEFEVSYSGFEHEEILDEGTKVIQGYWDGDEDLHAWVKRGTPSLTNPESFIRYKDFNGENARVILDGTAGREGMPWRGEGYGNPNEITIKAYSESNFLLLGIPTTF